MVCYVAFVAEWNVKASISEAPPFCSEFTQASPQIRIIGEAKYGSIGFAITTCDGAGSTLTKPDLINHRPSSSSPLRGR
ncbi:MAG: hypothetical protein NVSMB64_14440 [Candidatus Velthaea sp.]